MEREKKEYRKNREWEKEKERERLAMERMAVERRRQEGDSRVIFHDCIFLTCLLFPYKTVFPLWDENHNFCWFPAKFRGCCPAQDTRGVRVPKAKELQASEVHGFTRRNVPSVKKQKCINKCFARVFQASTAAHTRL